MNVRPYHELDRPALGAIRATCPPGAFFADPNETPNSPAFVVEDGPRGVVGAIVYRMTAEPFIYVDQTLPAMMKWRAVKTLAVETAPRLLERGIQELHLFPNDKTFAWRLIRKLKGVFGDTRLHLVWHLSRAFGG
jgi:hypothetical protein